MSDDAMKALADRLEEHVLLMANTGTDLSMKNWNTVSNDILLAARTLRAALTPPADDHPLSGVTHAMWSEMVRTSNEPPADDEVVAIRRRHEEYAEVCRFGDQVKQDYQYLEDAHTDRATLLRALDAERARRVEVEWEVERLEEEGADFVRSQFLPELDEFSNLLLIDFLWVSSALLGNLDWLTEVTGEAPEDEDAIMVAEARKRYEHYRDLQANARAATITKETP